MMNDTPPARPTIWSIVLNWLPPGKSLRLQAGLALFAGFLFWLQISRPSAAVSCWSALGALLFLALSYPDRFWGSITGIFGFEAGILAGLLVGIENHSLWIGSGFAGCLGLTALTHRFRWYSRGSGEGENGIEPQVMAREVGLGAAAGSLAATLLTGEVLRLYLLAALLVAGRVLMDKKE